MILGIVGGVGSGKSAVARLFQDAGCQTVDADQIGHEALKDPKVQRQIRDTFGHSVFGCCGTLDRSRLASRVFESRENIDKLNQISHPLIRERILEEIKRHERRVQANEASGVAAILVLDVSLLPSSPLRKHCDYIVFVDTDRETRRQRCADRGWSDEEMDKRESFQLSLEEKRALASSVISNSGPLEETRRQVIELLGELIGEQEVGRDGG